MRTVRALLVLLGAAGSAYGGWLLWPDLATTAAWLLGGPVLHDAVIAPVVGLAGLLLIRVLRRIGVGMDRLRTVAGGSGTELRISTLLLRQGSKYRVAALAHRRFLSCAVVRLVGEHTVNVRRSGIGSRKNLPGLSQETLPA